jgi:hypothetical protein
VIAAWPAVSLVGSYELLVWLIRTCGAADRGPSAGRLCTGAAYCAAARPVPAPAADAERPAGSERGTSGPAWRPACQAAGPSPAPAGGQRDDEVLEASAGKDAAVAAYLLSVQAGNALSERRLAQMFGRTSRRWARARIADARQASPLPDSPGHPGHGLPVSRDRPPSLRNATVTAPGGSGIRVRRPDGCALPAGNAAHSARTGGRTGGLCGQCAVSGRRVCAAGRARPARPRGLGLRGARSRCWCGLTSLAR